MRKLATVCLLLLILSCKGKIGATVDPQIVKSTVEGISNAFNQDYVFPDIGKQVANQLLDKLKLGHYDQAKDYEELSIKLKSDILEITQDKHVAVNYHVSTDEKPSFDEGEHMRKYFNSFKNFGLVTASILEGNIGYLEIQIFYPLELNPQARSFAMQTMQRFGSCKALIVDVRKCGGGSATMLNLLVSYLFPKGKQIHLNNFYYRPTNTTDASYSEAFVEGETYPDMPVFVLSSNKTFSCAEEFCYDIQSLKRGKIIGERTGGGAHTVESRKINEWFEIILPTGRAINPITGSNWEGVGVKPNIEVSSELALEKALSIIQDL